MWVFIQIHTFEHCFDKVSKDLVRNKRLVKFCLGISNKFNIIFFIFDIVSSYESFCSYLCNYLSLEKLFNDLK